MTGEVGYIAPLSANSGADRRAFSPSGRAFPWAALDLGRVRARIGSAKH